MTTNNRFINWCLRYIRLPFPLTLCAIAALYCFNDNSALTYYDDQVEISRLKAEIKANTDTFEYYRALNENLQRNREELERIVRERHHMQSTNEEVYIMN